MKKLFNLRNVLICIAFAVILLFVKDNINVVWNIICTFAGVLTPFVVGFLIAYILNYPYKFFYATAFGKIGTKRKQFDKLRKPLAIVCTYICVFAILIVLIWIVVPQIVENITSLIESMPGYIDTCMRWINGIINWLNSSFNLSINEDNIFSQISDKLFKFITQQDMSKIGDWANQAFNVVTSTISGVYNFGMGIIISIYFLAAKEQLCYQVKKLAVAVLPIKSLPKIYEIVDITDTKCGRFIVGDIIDAAVIGVLHFIVLALLNIPYAPLISVLVGITNIIPFFGPFIGSIPSCFILLIINPWDMIIFLAVNIVIQQVDGNLIKPKIIGSQVGLSSFWVLFSVLVGGALFGFPGLILGTPIYAVIYYLVGKFTKNKINDKGKIAQEALNFEVLNYAKIAAEQKRIRELKETQQRERLKKFMHLNINEKSDESSNSSEKDKDDNDNSGNTDNND